MTISIVLEGNDPVNIVKRQVILRVNVSRLCVLSHVVYIIIHCCLFLEPSEINRPRRTVVKISVCPQVLNQV